MSDLLLGCQCKKVSGIVRNISPGSCNRLVCYCKDCQAFANHLGRDSGTLNGNGGTEVIQIPPSHMQIQQGIENISCLRLTEKGLYRWYASCCNTPIGNTLTPGMPFIGLIHSFVEPDRESIIGPILGAVNTEGITGNPSKEVLGNRSQLSLTIRVIRKLLSWKLSGKGKPNPLFNNRGQPIVVPEVLN